MKSLKSKKNIFQWLNEITLSKPSSDSFSENDWETFNAYMVHRFVSMYQGYVEIANIAQRFHPTDKKGIYNFYCEMLPRKKMFLKFSNFNSPYETVNACSSSMTTVVLAG